uniref:Uncharacterized protein n=1 Tax=Solanum lycopersicum TaxID=4081 RepID=A0A3Q7IAV2_SOLLC
MSEHGRHKESNQELEGTTLTRVDVPLGLYLSLNRSGKLSITAEAATQISGYIGYRNLHRQ